MHTRSGTPLKNALLMNAAFSAVSGATLMLAPEWVGTIMGLSIPTVYALVGLGLIVFALDLMVQATRKTISKPRALLASIGDLSWVMGTAAVLIVAGEEFSALGVAVMIAIAATVLLFGVLQLRGLALLRQGPIDSIERGRQVS